MILQIMFFGGLVGKLSKFCKVIETYVYKEKAWRECVCERAIALRETLHITLVWKVVMAMCSINKLCYEISTFNNIMYMYSHHSSKNHLEMVQWLIKNAKLNDDTAGYVLRWACGWVTKLINSIIESHNYISRLCMLALGNIGKGVYAWDYIFWWPLTNLECHMGADLCISLAVWWAKLETVRHNNYYYDTNSRLAY